MRRGRVTVRQMMSYGPCYSKDRIKAMWNGRSYLTYRGIAALKIRSDDRLWALIKLMTDKQQHEISCDFAETVLHLCDDDQDRQRKAIAMKRRWIKGDANDEELAAARAAALAAAWAAAYDRYIKIAVKKLENE